MARPSSGGDQTTPDRPSADANTPPPTQTKGPSSTPDSDGSSSSPSAGGDSATDLNEDDDGQVLQPGVPSPTGNPDRPGSSEQNPSLPSGPASTDSRGGSTSTSQGSSSVPPVGGIVAGVIFGLLAILALIFLWRYRRAKQRETHASPRELALLALGLKRPSNQRASGAILLGDDDFRPNSPHYPDMVQVPAPARRASGRSMETLDSAPSVFGVGGTISMFPMPPSANSLGRPDSNAGSAAWSDGGGGAYGTHPTYQPDWTPVQPRPRPGAGW
ncbi:uncharacterized protein DNG_02201 [Cephalotrichum gorgonifer]|uniref:Uncharacterized protein n=1 Tax=Cephalotrichum gorgonifer TaxID=2041049 RepID=A0AAE8SSE1_9PEZI|nr:uncharacterized protein DNG_02201 [Cephalotrichum gorgonifer]